MVKKWKLHRLAIRFAEVSMSNQQGFSHFEINNIVEGTRTKGESEELIDDFQMTTVSIAHSGFGDKDFSAEEGLPSHANVVFEGRDDTDVQDAALTTDEVKPYPDYSTRKHKSIKLPIQG